MNLMIEIKHPVFEFFFLLHIFQNNKIEFPFCNTNSAQTHKHNIHIKSINHSFINTQYEFNNKKKPTNVYRYSKLKIQI